MVVHDTGPARPANSPEHGSRARSWCPCNPPSLLAGRPLCCLHRARFLAGPPVGQLDNWLVLGAAILILDRSARRRLLRLAAALLTAGVITGLLKAVFSRQRPLHFELDQDIWSSFSGFFSSLMQDGEWIAPQHWTMVSFPSGHVTSAAAAAVGLSWLYPRGRWLLAGMAVLVAAERIAFQLHFLSDLCAGAAIGTLVMACFLDTRMLGRRFDHFEEVVQTGP